MHAEPGNFLRSQPIGRAGARLCKFGKSPDNGVRVAVVVRCGSCNSLILLTIAGDSIGRHLCTYRRLSKHLSISFPRILGLSS